jgi:hypothetical protein
MAFHQNDLGVNTLCFDQNDLGVKLIRPPSYKEYFFPFHIHQQFVRQARTKFNNMTKYPSAFYTKCIY